MIPLFPFPPAPVLSTDNGLIFLSSAAFFESAGNSTRFAGEAYRSTIFSWTPAVRSLWKPFLWRSLRRARSFSALLRWTTSD